MKVNAIICLKCGDTVYSRANHDCRWCSCRSCYIDGGQENPCYRIGGNPGEIQGVHIEVDATIKELYDDWNTRKDKYGRVSP